MALRVWKNSISKTLAVWGVAQRQHELELPLFMLATASELTGITERLGGGAKTPIQSEKDDFREGKKSFWAVSFWRWCFRFDVRVCVSAQKSSDAETTSK